ncbi:ROK family protein [Dactylosporangium sp. NPDC051541]|uniref:ROK family protein n=1 Tax=Dactylosporangium sp. NPDC051541 TaxID=3363977 RepID=UPI00379BF77C
MSPAGRPRTRAAVFDLVRAARRISRVDLAARSGLTPATITEVVRELLELELVVEAGRGASTGGKPPMLIELNPEARYAVGVLYERNLCTVTVVDLTGRAMATSSSPGTSLMPPEQALPVVAERIGRLLDEAGIERGRVLGAGLATYGPQDRRAGVVLTHQPTADWFGHPVAGRLSELLGLPVLLDNDAVAAAIGEHWLGGVGSGTFGCLYMASGIGGGVVVDGEVYRGASSNGVEVGHITVDVDGGPCDCGNHGCLGNYADPRAVIGQAMRVPGLDRRLGLDPADSDVITSFVRIAAAASGGDPEARTLIERSARLLGTAAVTLTTLFDLECIVLAGPAFGAATWIYQSVIQDELQRRAFVRRVHPVRVVPSVNGSDAAAIGAAALVLQSELASLQLQELYRAR